MANRHSRSCAIALSMTSAVAACDGPTHRDHQVDISEQRLGTEIGEPEFGLATSVEDLTEDIGRFVGRPLSLQGEVVRVLGPQVFAMGGESVRFNQQLIVISPSPVPELDSENTGLPRAVDPTVRVYGTLRRLSPGAIDQQFGPDVLAQVSPMGQGRPLLIAEAVRLVPVPGPNRVR